MSQNSSNMFKNSNQPSLPDVSGLSEHEVMIFNYLVNDQHMQPEQARQKILNNDDDIVELRIIESPTTHPLRK